MKVEIMMDNKAVEFYGALDKMDWMIRVKLEAQFNEEYDHSYVGHEQSFCNQYGVHHYRKHGEEFTA